MKSCTLDDFFRNPPISDIKGYLYFVFADIVDSVYFGCVIRWHYLVPPRIWPLLQFWGSHLPHLRRLVTWIKGDLGQCRNLFNRAHIQGNMWNLVEQMVILAIRTLFANSDCNHSHQHGFSYVSVSFVTPRKTHWQQTHCKWSGEVHVPQPLRAGAFKPADCQRVYTGVQGWDTVIMRNRSPGYHSQIWNAVNRIPDSHPSQFFNKGNDPRCLFLKLINFRVQNSSDPTAAPQLQRLGYVPLNSGWTPGLTK